MLLHTLAGIAWDPQIRGFLADYVDENLPGYISGYVAGVAAVRAAAATDITTAVERE